MQQVTSDVTISKHRPLVFTQATRLVLEKKLTSEKFFFPGGALAEISG
jgi:hypothetical protein